jgi:hypothetical protein
VTTQQRPRVARWRAPAVTVLGPRAPRPARRTPGLQAGQQVGCGPWWTLRASSGQAGKCVCIRACCSTDDGSDVCQPPACLSADRRLVNTHTTLNLSALTLQALLSGWKHSKPAYTGQVRTPMCRAATRDPAQGARPSVSFQPCIECHRPRCLIMHHQAKMTGVCALHYKQGRHVHYGKSPCVCTDAGSAAAGGDGGGAGRRAPAQRPANKGRGAGVRGLGCADAGAAQADGVGSGAALDAQARRPGDEAAPGGPACEAEATPPPTAGVMQLSGRSRPARRRRAATCAFHSQP